MSILDAVERRCAKRCIPGGFEEPTLLRVHACSFSRRDAEEGGVEVEPEYEEPAPEEEIVPEEEVAPETGGAGGGPVAPEPAPETGGESGGVGPG